MKRAVSSTWISTPFRSISRQESSSGYARLVANTGIAGDSSHTPPQLERIAYLTDPGRRSAFLSLLQPYQPSPAPKISLQRILTYETTLARCARIWLERRQERHQRLPSRRLWQLFDRTVLSSLGSRSVRQLFEAPAELTRQLTAIETDLGASAAAGIHRLLCSVGHMMHAQALTPLNPCSNIYSPAVGGMPIYLLSDDQRRQIFDLARKDSRLAPPAFCLATGILLGEFARLSQRDLCCRSQSLRLEATPSSKRFSRTIPLSSQAMAIVASARWQSRQPDAPLFATPSGKRYSAANAQRPLTALREATGLRDLSYRNIQRDFIVNALLKGVDPIQLKDYLGLKHPRLILTLWQHLAQARNS